MPTDIPRRRFMGTALAAGSYSIVPRRVLGGPGYVAPNDKITLAHIGVGSQGIKEIGGLLADPRIQIVAVCDPNRNSEDYVEWGKNGIRNKIRSYLDNPTWGEHITGCPGGREIGREIVEGYYADNRGDERYQGCATYADFRELLAEESDVDAVKIMTPDHLHATIAIAAMRSGRHVFMHKPIANRLYEGRLVLETARETGCITHLLAYGSGAGNRLIADQVAHGAIGNLREIHHWSHRPVWPQYIEIPRDEPPIPDGLDWPLWLGPERDRPYHPHYTHTVFRGWYDFGGGSIGDMALYSLWPIFDLLDLPVPVSASARATHACSILDNVSRPIRNSFSYPAACEIRYHFDESEKTPDFDLFWYDGGMKPRLPAEIETHDVVLEREGILFIGDEGSILAGFHGQEPQIFQAGQAKLFIPEEPTSYRIEPNDRYMTWADAVLADEESPGSFLNAGPITDMVNLGAVALRAGGKVVFDSEKMEIVNLPSANKFLRRDYREGWEL
jgi:predicted dehydrogenase